VIVVINFVSRESFRALTSASRDSNNQEPLEIMANFLQTLIALPFTTVSSFPFKNNWKNAGCARNFNFPFILLAFHLQKTIWISGCSCFVIILNDSQLLFGPHRFPLFSRELKTREIEKKGHGLELISIFYRLDRQSTLQQTRKNSIKNDF
jgi:hypothetical protein